MFLKYFVLFFLLTNLSLHAKDFHYEYGAKKYSVTYTDEIVQIKSLDMNLSVSNQKCFKKKFQEIFHSVSEITTRAILKKFQKGDAIALAYGGDLYGAEEDSILGRRLLNLPRDMIKMKLIEKELCRP